MKGASLLSQEVFALFWNEFRANWVREGSFPNMVVFYQIWVVTFWE